MKGEDNERKYKRTGNELILEGQKKVHLDPFAQLEQAMQDVQEMQGNEKDDRLLLRHPIEIQSIDRDDFVYETYIPLSFERKVIVQQREIYGKHQPIIQELLNIISREESLYYLAEAQDEVENILLTLAQLFKKSQLKHLFSSNSYLNNKHAKLLSNNMKSNIYLSTTFQTLQKLTFTDLNKLQRYSYVIFQVTSFSSKEIYILQELLITLPLHLQYIILARESISNHKQFVNWLAALRVRPFNYLAPKQTTKTPVVYIFPSRGQELLQVFQQNGKLHQQNIITINQLQRTSKASKNKQSFTKIIKEITKTLYSLNHCPFLFHSFKKRQIEEYARIIYQSFDFTTLQQKKKIQTIYSIATLQLQQNSEMKEIQLFKEYLMRGIGIYHKGLLPLLAELVQILSDEGLLTVIVTNETLHHFKVKCTFLTNIKNEEPTGIRLIRNTQVNQLCRKIYYQQQILMLYTTQVIEQDKIKTLFGLEPQLYESQFQLDINSTLNYHCFEDMDATYILQRSFRQFQNHRKSNILKEESQQLEQELNSVAFGDKELALKLAALHQKKKILESKWKKLMHVPQKLIPYLSVGRLVKFKDNENLWGYGVVVNVHRIQANKKLKIERVDFFIDALVYVTGQVFHEKWIPKPKQLHYTSQIDQNNFMTVLTFDLEAIDEIASTKISALPNNLLDENNIETIFQTLKILVLDQPKAIELECTTRQALDLKQAIKSNNNELDKLSYLSEYYQSYEGHEQLKAKIKIKKDEIKALRSTVFKKDLKKYIKVLKLLNYVQKGKLNTRGRAAQIISLSSSILIVELINGGFFSEELNPSEIAALMVSYIDMPKTLTSRQKVKNIRIRQKLNEMLFQCQNLAKVYKQAKIDISEDEIKSTIKQHFIEAILRWCQGQAISEICSTYQIYEGALMQVINKLEKLLQSICQAIQIFHNANPDNRQTLIQLGMVRDAVRVVTKDLSIYQRVLL